MLLTANNQITIPSHVLKKLGVTPQTEMNFLEENGKFYLFTLQTPSSKKPFKDLRGVATVNKSTDEILMLTREDL